MEKCTSLAWGGEKEKKKKRRRRRRRRRRRSRQPTHGKEERERKLSRCMTVTLSCLVSMQMATRPCGCAQMQRAMSLFPDTNVASNTTVIFRLPLVLSLTTSCLHHTVVASLTERHLPLNSLNAKLRGKRIFFRAEKPQTILFELRLLPLTPDNPVCMNSHNLLAFFWSETLRGVRPSNAEEPAS